MARAVDRLEHQKVEEAKPGDSVGLKVSQKIRDGYKAFAAM